ncbi:NUDIX hydrolase [Tepidiforma sp.]|uniref:NUDIX hydrolase n=1 Tax=Tepidiforma sp. TaxID=2682230 RepID=UPI002ADE4F5A|nr:NUDIX hydrolase [Tepidiforma sp.]
MRYPGVGVAVIVRDGAGRVLLGRRAAGRRAGLWCIPCGRLEWGEDVREAAIREFREETGLIVVLDGVYEVHSNFHDADRLTVGIWFSGRVVGEAGQEVDGELCEVGWFDPAQPPELAFPTDGLVLRRLAMEGQGQ